MHLTVGVPESEAASEPTILRLIRAATAWQVEADEEGPVYVAIFDDVPRSPDAVIQLLEAASDLSCLRVTIDGRQVANVTELWSVLLCYQESLGEQNKEAYCVRRAGQVGERPAVLFEAVSRDAASSALAAFKSSANAEDYG